MPLNANVFINYGPYKSNGIVEHRVDRLQGLKTYLEAKGHKIAGMNKTSCWDNVEVVVNEELVFKCKIQELDFTGDGELDNQVVSAESAVRKAY